MEDAYSIRNPVEGPNALLASSRSTVQMEDDDELSLDEESSHRFSRLRLSPSPEVEDSENELMFSDRQHRLNHTTHSDSFSEERKLLL